jgi:threonine/homoserine/homoserine lactone efflux protein
MALVTKNALLHGRRPALATALGVNVGIAFWTATAALGVAAVVAASATAFAAIKLAGAVYLVYLGVQALRASRMASEASEYGSERRLPDGLAFRQGVLSNLLNPKIAVFFTSLLPQFVGSHADTRNLLLLGALFNAMGVVWLLGYAALAARGRAVLARPRIKRTLDRISGTVLIGLGVRLALEHRPLTSRAQPVLDLPGRLPTQYHETGSARSDRLWHLGKACDWKPGGAKCVAHSRERLAVLVVAGLAEKASGQGGAIF